jgi:hypothetical protein
VLVTEHHGPQDAGHFRGLAPLGQVGQDERGAGPLHLAAGFIVGCRVLQAEVGNGCDELAHRLGQRQHAGDQQRC